MLSKDKGRQAGAIAALAAAAALAAILYMTVGVDFSNPRLWRYSLSLRAPRLVAMVVTATAIGASSIAFQTVIDNRIVTPCLLGMNSLYSLIHTAVFFAFGSTSVLARSPKASFAVDVVVMGVAATVIYGWLFRKTGRNALYVLLIGTVLTSLFSSVQNTLVRVMDPNEYDAVLTTLVASFSNMNTSIIAMTMALLAIVALVLRKDIALLDVISLGKDTATNLGVDYGRTVGRILLGVTIAIAVATALAGPVSFIGLIIANIARQMTGTYRHKVLVPAAALSGVTALVAGQLLVERVFSYAIPVSVFITIAGGLYFLYLLLAGKNV